MTSIDEGGARRVVLGRRVGKGPTEPDRGEEHWTAAVVKHEEQRESRLLQQ